MPDTKPPAPLPRVRGVSPLIWRRLLIPFEDLVVWLVTRSDKSTVAAFARVAWRTVGAMCERVAAEKLDPTRLAGLVDIGVDEISWRRLSRPGARCRGCSRSVSPGRSLRCF